MGKVSSNMLSATRNAPNPSRRLVRSSLDLGSTLADSPRASRPTGTLTRKIGRQAQPNKSSPISKPPQEWPRDHRQSECGPL